MSNNESFIDEVTEEVRRDKLYGLFRRYGWIGVALILAIVIGTGVNEWLKSRAEARAEAFGDAVIDAFDMGTPEERRTALAAVAADGEQQVILALAEASDPEQDKPATLAALDAVLADGALAPQYRDLAVLRRVIVAGADQPLAERRTALDGIAVSGRPYAALAREQLAYLLLEEGKLPEAIAALQELTAASDASAGLKDRAGQVITALGGAPEAEPAPETPEAPAEAAPAQD